MQYWAGTTSLLNTLIQQGQRISCHIIYSICANLFLISLFGCSKMFVHFQKSTPKYGKLLLWALCFWINVTDPLFTFEQFQIVEYYLGNVELFKESNFDSLKSWISQTGKTNWDGVSTIHLYLIINKAIVFF